MSNFISWKTRVLIIQKKLLLVSAFTLDKPQRCGLDFSSPPSPPFSLFSNYILTAGHPDIPTNTFGGSVFIICLCNNYIHLFITLGFFFLNPSQQARFAHFLYQKEAFAWVNTACLAAPKDSSRTKSPPFTKRM